MNQQEIEYLAVQRAMESFLHAFANLEWELFCACFAQDATVFNPFAKAAQRHTGKEEVLSLFERLFADARTQKSEPPYLTLVPSDLAIQLLGEVAVVTFHLANIANRLGRRTFVLQKREGKWLIVHLHASTLTLE